MICNNAVLTYETEKYKYVLEVEGPCKLSLSEDHTWDVYEDTFTLNFSRSKYKIIPKLENYVEWHVLNYGNPGGGHETDRLQQWSEYPIEVPAESIREIAELFKKARVVFDG